MSAICAAVYVAVHWPCAAANWTPVATTSAIVPATSSPIVTGVAKSATKITDPARTAAIVAVVGDVITATVCVVTSNTTPSAAVHRIVSWRPGCGASSCVTRTSSAANRVNATTVPAVALTEFTVVPDPSPAHTRRTTHGASYATVHDWPYVAPATSVVIPASALVPVPVLKSTENAAVDGGAKNTTSSV